MSDGSSIQWCDATWQPVVGCTRVSAGCDNCYAIGTVHRFRKADGLTKLRSKHATRPGLDWSGAVALQAERLADPLKWRKPRRVFVCSQADLFHDAVPFEFIAAVFGVMAACPQHTFLVLTKRPERAREFFAWYRAEYGPSAAGVLVAADDAGLPRGFDALASTAWPLANVHLGVSVEDQKAADGRIPVLLELPAALHWVSAEPLLDMVVLRNWTPERARMGFVAAEYERMTGIKTGDDVLLKRGPHLGWVVVGGESGPRARRFDIEWARSLVKRCAEDGVPIFVKQLGSKPEALDYPGGYLPLQLADYSGGDMYEWPADIRVREVPA